ncbi:MAG: homocysteine S-methyltransferase, partial [Gemmataceae bacterium]|nr:homocysteine S-methyltransferase [Gemmataceae bacterium]
EEAVKKGVGFEAMAAATAADGRSFGKGAAERNLALIRQVHLDYFRAGADVGASSSYQASFPGFARRGIDAKQAAELLRLSVRLVQEARAQFWDEPANRDGRCRPLVAASIGCYGAALHDGSEYRGNYGLSVRELIDWHRPRLEVLAASGADLLACETIPSLVEAEALVRLLEEFREVPAWISFSCQDGEHLCEGAPFLDAVGLAQSAANVVAVGVNCTPPRFVEELLASVHGETSIPLLAYPNSGERWNAAEQRWEPGAGCLGWGEAARRWRAAGARLIGGCCRTTPETIGEIASALRAVQDQ